MTQQGAFDRVDRHTFARLRDDRKNTRKQVLGRLRSSASKQGDQPALDPSVQDREGILRRSMPDLAGAIDPLMRDVEGAALLCCSKATWWRRVADGTLPSPLKIGGISRWKQAEVIAAIERAARERDA